MTKTLDGMMHDALAIRFTRRGLFKGPVVAGAGALALSALGGSFAAMTVAAGPLDSDLEILNYALTLEHLEAAAYKAVNGAGVLTGRAATYFQSFGQHETDHVAALMATIKQLGGTPVQPSVYNFSSVPKDMAGIVTFFQTVESVGASAYLGAAGSIKNFDVLEAALSIHAVEAEHASALADLSAPGTDLFAPEAFATPRTPAQVMQIVAPFFTGAGPATAPATGGTGNTNSGSGTGTTSGTQGGSSATATGNDFSHFIRRLGDG